VTIAAATARLPSTRFSVPGHRVVAVTVALGGSVLPIASGVAVIWPSTPVVYRWSAYVVEP
jgi:hypothetical protein